MFRIHVFIVLLTAAQSASAQLSRQFDSLFKAFYQKGLFDGTALVADSSGIVFHRSFGIANHEYGIPNDTTTIFRVGSLEKQFTAMLTLQLVEKKKLSLDGKITDYLPEYRKETGSRVTIQHLLTHTSGIPNYTSLPNAWNDSMQLQYQPAYLLRNFCSGDLEFQPGTKYQYSNTGYFILAQIIERVTGRPVATLLEENILRPARMTRTGLVDKERPSQNSALGYYRLSNTYINEPFIYAPNTIGAASLYATAYDLYLWDRILYTSELLSPRYMELYRSPQFTVAPDYAYGFGWEFSRVVLSPTDTIQTMEHSGAIRAFRANIFRVPAEKACVILLSNSANQSAYELFENIMYLFRKRSWNAPKSLLADTLFAEMQSSSIENAILLYKKMKVTDSASYDYSSYALELLGERLLMLSMYQEAAAIFTLAVNEDPAYTYGYFYLGRTFEKWGKRREAIAAYQKAVAQDKNSRPGIDAAFQLKHLATGN